MAQSKLSAHDTKIVAKMRTYFKTSDHIIDGNLSVVGSSNPYGVSVYERSEANGRRQLITFNIDQVQEILSISRKEVYDYIDGCPAA